MKKEETQGELLPFDLMIKPLCVKCKERPVYQNLKNMDWCEECINQFVMECNE